jgi:hypothetical protein
MHLKFVAIMVLLASLLWLPGAWVIDRATGVTGYEMESILPDDERPASLADWGIDESDAISDKLEAFGKVGASARGGEQHRFVFVSAQRVLETELGTLIVFDRAAGEELLQARSLYNLALLLTGADVLAGLLLLWLARLASRRSADRIEA